MTPKRKRKAHSEATRAKMRLAQSGVPRPKRWILPEADIVERLLVTSATTRSIAKEFGCSDSTIKLIFRKHTTQAQRGTAKIAKQGRTLRRIGAGNPNIWRFSNWSGRKHSPETRRKQSLKKQGLTLPLTRRIAQSARLQGRAVEDWKGFATNEKTRQRKGRDLQRWRMAVFSRDNHTCLMCGKRGGYLHAHHVRPFAQYLDLRFDVNNGATLCAEPCHKATIGREYRYFAFFDRVLRSGDKKQAA